MKEKTIEELYAEAETFKQKYVEALRAKEEAEKAAKTNERAELARKIETAYKAAAEARLHRKEVYEEETKKVNDAENAYIELKNDFIEKYGSFHMTYVDKEPKVTTDDSGVDSGLFELLSYFFS